MIADLGQDSQSLEEAAFIVTPSKGPQVVSVGQLRLDLGRDEVVGKEELGKGGGHGLGQVQEKEERSGQMWQDKTDGLPMFIFGDTSREHEIFEEV